MRTIMCIKQTLGALAVALSFALAASAAQAITVTAVVQSKPISSDVLAANNLEGTLAGTGSLSQIPGTTPVRSPWTALNASSAADREFLYVRLGGSITFDLMTPANGAVPAATASLLWGSPDTHNKLELLREGSVVATIIPGAAGAGVPANSNFTYLVTISDIVFDTLVFSASGTSFEFANLAATPEFTGELGCGDAETAPGTTLRRLNDLGVESAAGCAPPVPSRLDFDGSTLTFLADYEVLEGAEPAFAFDVAWRTEWVEEIPPPLAIPHTVGGPNPPPATPTAAQAVSLSVQWFGLSAVPERPYLLDSCPGNPIFAPQPDLNGNPVLVALEFPAGFVDDADGVNDMSDLPGFQYGCLISRDVELVEDATECSASEKPSPNATCVRVKESGYLRGDWTATRTLR